MKGVKGCLLNCSIFVFVFMFILWILVSILSYFSTNDEYTLSHLEQSPIYTYSDYESKTINDDFYIFNGNIALKQRKNVVISSEISNYVTIIVNKKDNLKNPKSNLDSLSINDKISIIGKIEKIDYDKQKVYITDWYYDSSLRDKVDLRIEEQKRLEEEQIKLEEEKRLEEERIKKEEEVQKEYENLIKESESIPIDINNIKKLEESLEKLILFKKNNPNFDEMDKLDYQINVLDVCITGLMGRKSNSNINKSNDMTISDGHKELDSILKELENIIVSDGNESKFRNCMTNLNYDNIVLLGSEKLNNTITELYSIIRVPSDTTEYDKLIDRFDSFVDKCPNFYEDDMLNHKWELINNIILKPLR